MAAVAREEVAHHGLERGLEELLVGRLLAKHAVEAVRVVLHHLKGSEERVPGRGRWHAPSSRHLRAL